MKNRKILSRKLGERIQRARRQAGISQEELAFRCGLAPRYIAYIEEGQRIPSLVTLYTIAEALDRNAEDFIKED